MELGPIFSALRRNKVGAALICLQIALALAIVCNSLFIIQGRMQRMQRPSGVDEANIFTLMNLPVGARPDPQAAVRADLALVRSTPGVVDAIASNTYPLRGGGWSTSVARQKLETYSPDNPSTALYFTDEHGLTTLGLKLVEGRGFEPQEVQPMGDGDQPRPSVLIATRALAQAVFPEGNALGKQVWFEDLPVTIVGIVERLQTPWAATGFGEPFVENSVLLPLMYAGGGLRYVVRTQPGQRDAVMHEVEKRLMAADRQRVIEDLQPLSEARAERYRGDRALNLILGTVSTLLLAVTACGIVGLTSYWITQRRRQIGVRRALGARRRDVLRYFHVENLMIAGAAIVVGVGLAIAGNLWLVKSFEMQRMGLPFVLAAAAIVLTLGQAAVLWPALRASGIPPALATRAV